MQSLGIDFQGCFLLSIFYKYFAQNDYFYWSEWFSSCDIFCQNYKRKVEFKSGKVNELSERDNLKRWLR